MADIVKINVGGVEYNTTRDTLTHYPESKLAKMLGGEGEGEGEGEGDFEGDFEGEGEGEGDIEGEGEGEGEDCDVTKDDQGRYFFDRDGLLFRYVLNFLRYPELQQDLTMPEDFKELEMLGKEATFYQIKPLVDAISNAIQTKTVKINVGGVEYNTTRDTLTRIPKSKLGKMFSGGEDSDVTTDDQGRYFIDRDGSLFGYVLNFLRDPKHVMPEDFKELDTLYMMGKEAEFYQLQPLVHAIEKAKLERSRSPFVRIAEKEFRDADINNVPLNIGGVTYNTTWTTLQRYDSKLNDLGRIARIDLPMDDQDRYFIDRDGPLFRYILNFLRDSELVLPDDFKELDMLMKEAVFYKIQELIYAIDKARQER